MSKIKLIIGNSPNHLLAMAETMAFRKNYQIIQGESIRKLFDRAYDQCNRETEVIIINELPILYLYSIVGTLSSGEICIKRKGTEPYLHQVQVIITCICKTEWLIKDPHFLEHVTLIESRVSSYPDVEPVQLPASVAESIGNQYFKDRVIVISWDKGTGSTTVTSWGNTQEDKERADKIIKQAIEDGSNRSWSPF